MSRCPAILALALVAACATTATDRGNTIVYASGADLQSINPLLTTHPLARQVQRYVLLTTLVQRDSALRIVPYLAREWTWSADSSAVTFRLATMLRWHDGAATTAHDAAWTLDAARDPVVGYPRLSELAAITGVVAPDDSTLEITFNAPQHQLPDVLTDLAVLPAHCFAGLSHEQIRGAAWNRDPVGNGPFRFVSHEQNRRWLFVRDSAFPPELGGPARVHRLAIAVVDEPTTKLAALTSGELDFAGIQPAHAAFVARDPHLAVIRYPLLLTYVVAFNVRQSPLDDIDVRRAISIALDRRAIIGGFLFGFGAPASGPATADSTPRAADTAAARQLLHGRHLSIELLTVGSGEAALEQMIQAQLRAIGIDVTIRQIELTTFLDRLSPHSHAFQMAVMGVPGDLGLGEIAPLLQESGIAPGTSPATSRRRLVDSVAVAFLYHAGGVQGMNRRVMGVTMDVRGELASLRHWHVRE